MWTNWSVPCVERCLAGRPGWRTCAAMAARPCAPARRPPETEAVRESASRRPLPRKRSQGPADHLPGADAGHVGWPDDHPQSGRGHLEARGGHPHRFAIGVDRQRAAASRADADRAHAQELGLRRRGEVGGWWRPRSLRLRPRIVTRTPPAAQALRAPQLRHSVRVHPLGESAWWLPSTTEQLGSEQPACGRTSCGRRLTRRMGCHSHGGRALTHGALQQRVDLVRR